jgi:hypothetical protein
VRFPPRHLAAAVIAAIALLASQAVAWAGVCGAGCPQIAETCCDEAPVPADDGARLGADMGCCQLMAAAGCAGSTDDGELAPAPQAPIAVAALVRVSVPVVSDDTAHIAPGAGPPPARAPPTRTTVLLL